MATVSQKTRFPTPSLKRLKGAEKPYGSEYEWKLAGLLALRLRRKGLTFQVFTNVEAAHPFDDIVLRVLGPQPSTVFVQLKHRHAPDRMLDSKELRKKDGDFSLQKYHQFFEYFVRKHKKKNKNLLSHDERILHNCSVEDVRLVLFTNWIVPRCVGPSNYPRLSFALQDIFCTSSSGKSFFFEQKDTEIWHLYNNNPRARDYQKEFLPRLCVFSDQANSETLDELIRKELDAVFGGPLPRSKDFLAEYIASIRTWALDDEEVYPLSNRSDKLDKLLLKDLAQQARSAAGGSRLAFKQDQCSALRQLLSSDGAVHVRVCGVPQGHRAAKLLQILEEDFAEQWAYVDDEALRDFPPAALEAACAASRVLVVDVEQEVEKAGPLVTAFGNGRTLVVVTSGGIEKALQGWSQEWEVLEEDWRINQLTLEAQNKILDAVVSFQGRKMRLRSLEPTWRSLREDVDGAMLSALLSGTAAMGAAPPAPPDAHPDLPRTLGHPATLDPDVLRQLDPRNHHFVLSGFPGDFLQQLGSELKPQDDTDRDPNTNGSGAAALDSVRGENEGRHQSTVRRWTVLTDTDVATTEKKEAAFLKVCEENSRVSVHWLQCLGQREHEMAVVWRRTRGKTAAVAPFVLPASDACATEQPTCASEAVQHAAAWRHKCGLLVGEPGVGKSRFMQRLAAEARAGAPQRWAVLLPAHRHRNLLKQFPQRQELTKDHLVELLAAAAGVAAPASSVSEASRRYLQAALDHSGALSVFLDGVDEVCPFFKDKLVQLLMMLLETEVQLVWVSSRPEVEVVLSQILRCPTSFLHPFTVSQQKDYLCQHWSSTFNRSPEEFKDLAMKMVAVMQSAGRRGQRSLLDIPLHVQMAAEAYQTQVRQALSSGGSLPLQNGITRYQLYCHFVSTKRDLFKKRFGLLDANFEIIGYEEFFYEIHGHCAMFVLLSNGAYGDDHLLPFSEYLEKNRSKITREKNGILWLGEDGMPRFLHYTFVEFFAATWLISQVNDQNGPFEIAKSVWHSLVGQNASVELREILEHMLAEGHPLHQAVLEDSWYALKTALGASSDPNDSDSFGRTALHQAASLGHYYFGSLLFFY